MTDWMMGDRRSGSIEDRFTVREATEWIRDSGENPFFLYMNLQSSHLPFEVPADFQAPFDLPENIRSVSIEGGAMRVIGENEGGIEEINETLRIRYWNSLAYIDSLLARFMSALESSGELENSIVVVLADTGFSFYEHGSWGYGSIPWEEAANVPLIVSAPGIEGRDDHGVAELVDVAPTILSILGLPPYPGFQGEDLTTVPPENRSPAFIVTQTPIADAMGVVSGRWKYIFDADRKQAMLFDLETDPTERRNMVQQKPELFYELDTLLGLWRWSQIGYYSDRDLQAREFPPRFQSPVDLNALGRANRQAQ